MWFHKDCVDMWSFTFLAYSTTNVSWIWCRCNHPNFDRNLSHSFEIETTNNFAKLHFSGSENVNSPNSDFAPTQHSGPIPPFRPKNHQRNWRTLLINRRSLKGKVTIFLASLNYYPPDCILGSESWLTRIPLPVKFPLLNTKFCANIEIRKPDDDESLLLSENIMTWPSSLI